MRRAKLIPLVSALLFTVASLSSASDNFDPIPLKNWLLPIDQLSTLGAVPQTYTTPSRRIVANAVPSDPSSLVTMVPCRILDTRNPNGPYGGPKMNGTRTFDIDNGPCAGIPPNASAYSVNLTVTQTTVNGAFLTAWPTGSPQPGTATITWNEGLTLTNAAILPAGTGGAIDVFAAAATHLILDINGYFIEGSGGTRTIFVNGTGTDTDNGMSLLNALSGISGNSITNRFLVKLDAGIFDVGTNVVQMSAYVDIEGSGENATKIVSSRTSNATDTGSVIGADNSQLRSLTVENTGVSALTFGAAFYTPSGMAPSLTNVRLSSTGASWAIGLLNAGGSPVVRESTLSASNPIATNNLGVYHLSGAASINDTVISSSGTSASNNRSVMNGGGTPAFRRCHFTSGDGGAGTNPGIFNTGTPGTLYLYDSIVVSGSSSIRNFAAWNNRVSNSQLNSAISAVGGGTFICIASFNSAFTALNAGCL